MNEENANTESRKNLNPDLDPDTAFEKIDEEMKGEKTLVDQYQTFTAELLRLSLLGIAVLGFLYKDAIDRVPFASKVLISISIVSFGLAAAASIAFRYFSSERLLYFGWGLRFRQKHPEKSKRLLDSREHIATLCRICKAAAALLLALGAIQLSIAFLLPLFVRA